MVVTAGGESRRITKREAVVAQLVDKSAGADLRATKMLIDMLKDIEKQAGTAPAPEKSPLTAADEEVVENLAGAAAANRIIENSPQRQRDHRGITEFDQLLF